MARRAARVVDSQDIETGGSGLSPVRTVLVVAYDPATGGGIVAALQRSGFPALQAATAEQALYWASREPPALAIIDASLARWSRLAGELRMDGVAVLALTDDPRARAAALRAGCLDASLRELDAETLALRVGVLLGRGWVSETGRIAAGPLVVDLAAHRLIWRGAGIETSQLLLRLVAFLAAHAGQVVSTKVLLEQVWGEPWADPNKVHQAVWRLRRVLGEPAESVFIVGKQGHGYALLPDATPLRSRRSVASL